jgi:hypothetical protein
MTLTRERLDQIVATGTFDELIGTSESGWVEYKGQPYQIENDAAKRELAKDVSSFANASGGRILIGVRTKVSPTHFGDEVEDIRPSPQGLVNTTQYRDILGSWIYPEVEGLDVRWVATKTDATRGIVVVTVPEQKVLSKPFLIVRTLDGQKHIETVFGYAERKGTSNRPLSVTDLQSALRSGLNFDNQIKDRLDAIEATLKSGVPEHIVAPVAGISKEDLDRRIAESAAHGGLEVHRHIVMAVTPEPPSQLKTLFSNSQGSLKRRLEDPPSLRYAGWDLTHDGHAKIVRGEYVRVTSGNAKVVDLYRDGVMVLVALADQALLAWGRERDQRINPVALIELTYSFVSFYSFVLDEITAAPLRLSFRVELRNMHLGGEKSSIAPHGLRTTSQIFGHNEKYAPEDVGVRELSMSRDGFDPLAVTYQVIREIYLWFGLEEDKIPYFKDEGGVRIFDADAIKALG